jgi:hypothetical protein
MPNALPASAPGMPKGLRSSQDAINLIVVSEVSSKATYTKLYQGPTWPGGQSGVTFGIGYDCGYSTAAQIDADWAPHLPVEIVEAMQGVAGITGSAAHSHAHKLVGKVIIPWDAAMAVFEDRDMPKWENTVARSLPNTDKLHPDSFGALVSLAYNRGASFSTPGSRYAEMRSIHQHMAGQTFSLIPNDFRAMKRLWPKMLGLRLRRDNEAALFAKGLASS